MSSKSKETLLTTKFFFQGTNGRYKLFGCDPGSEKSFHALGIQVLHRGRHYERITHVTKTSESHEKYKVGMMEHQDISTVVTTRTFAHPSEGPGSEGTTTIDRQPIGATTSAGAWKLMPTKIFGEDYIIHVDGHHVVKTLDDLCADDAENAHGSSEWSISRWREDPRTSAVTEACVIRDTKREEQWAFYYDRAVSPPSSGILVVPINKCTQYTISVLDGNVELFVGLGKVTANTSPLKVGPRPVFWTIERKDASDNSFVISTTVPDSSGAFQPYVITVDRDSLSVHGELVSGGTPLTRGTPWHFTKENHRFVLGETLAATIDCIRKTEDGDVPTTQSVKGWKVNRDSEGDTIKLDQSDIGTFMLTYHSPLALGTPY